jgi:hypothetical protein
MAEEASALKTEVTARYVSLYGQYHTMSFPRGVALSDMQKALCSAFSKPYPKTEAGLVVNETLVFDAFSDRPLIHAAEGKDIRIIFATQTDMRHVDACFRGPRPSFEEDMRETPAASE